MLLGTVRVIARIRIGRSNSALFCRDDTLGNSEAFKDSGL